MELDKIQKRFEILKNIDQILDKHIDSEDYADKIKNDINLSDDAICLLLGEYYLCENAVPEKEQLNPQFIQIIKDNYEDKKRLCIWFRMSSVLVDNLVINYLNNVWYTREQNLAVLSEIDIKILNNLDPAYYYNNATYLTTIIRVAAHNINTNKYGKGTKYAISFNGKIIITPNMLIESILSDTYSYLKYEKIDNKLFEYIEKVDSNELKNQAANNIELYEEIMKYYFEMYKDGMPNFYEIYLTNEHQDKNYKQKMLKLNSLYSVDKIAAYTNKDIYV